MKGGKCVVVSRAITTSMMPSIGMVLGSVGSAEIINEINEQMNNSHFFNQDEDIFANKRKEFIDSLIKPINENVLKLKNVLNEVQNPNENKIRPLISEEDFKNVPPCMHLPILTYTPIKKLLNKGRIYGFGYDAENINKQEDVYDRLINNGKVDNISSDTLPDNGYIYHEEIIKSEDPILSFDELDMIEETRKFIDKLLKKKKDPTDFLNPIG